MMQIVISSGEQTPTLSLLASQYGETALYCEIQQQELPDSDAEASIQLQAYLWQLNDALRSTRLAAIEEIILGNHNLTVTFSPLEITPSRVVEWVAAQWKAASMEVNQRETKQYILNADFSTSTGPDLERVAASAGLTASEVVKLFCKPIYPVMFLGFQPGFTYLTGLPANLQHPRHDKPRARVPMGSIGIAGSQLGIYPFDSPGGWQIIGKVLTDELPLLSFESDTPAGINAGDSIRFRPVD